MFYLIYKQSGISSHSAIRAFARDHNIKKIGHSGTLDPLATGLLLVATDDDTKLLAYLGPQSKTYVATFELGLRADTYDTTGHVTPVAIDHPVSTATMSDVLQSFVGRSLQIPPPFSAKKIGGKRAYQLARQNQSVHLSPVPITVSTIALIAHPSRHQFVIKLTVSHGTYIRSIIHDIGQKLKTGAVMSGLERTAIGSWQLPPGTTSQPLDLQQVLPLATINITFDMLQKLWWGQTTTTSHPEGTYLLAYDQTIIGVGLVVSTTLQSKKLLGQKVKQYFSTEQHNK